MKRNPEATCSNCPFWYAMDPNDDFGWCRAKFPLFRSQVKKDAALPYEASWPATEETDWCGEHTDFELDLPVDPSSEVYE